MNKQSTAWLGLAGRGVARHGVARHGLARQARQGFWSYPMNDREDSRAAQGIEARILALRMRVAEAGERSRLARERSREAAEKARALAWDLCESLDGLCGLPVWVQGEVRRSSVTVRETPWPPVVAVSGSQGNPSYDLIAFTCRADLGDPGAEPWVEHDDTRVTFDQAQDLAVAAVEAALADEPPPTPAYPEDDIPF